MLSCLFRTHLTHSIAGEVSIIIFPFSRAGNCGAGRCVDMLREGIQSQKKPPSSGLLPGPLGPPAGCQKPGYGVRILERPASTPAAEAPFLGRLWAGFLRLGGGSRLGGPSDALWKASGGMLQGRMDKTCGRQTETMPPNLSRLCPSPLESPPRGNA